MQGLLPHDDGLVKPTKLNKGRPHPTKREGSPRVDRAHANGTFIAPDRFLRQPRNSIDVASAVLYMKRIGVERDRSVNQFHLKFTIADHVRRGYRSPCQRVRITIVDA